MTTFDPSPQIITIKEVYEKAVAMEAKMDFKSKEDNKTTAKFYFYVWMLFFFEFINFILNIVLIYYFRRI